MSDIETIEISITQARKLVERKNLVEKLTSNREFRKVILEGYLVDEASRLAGISADPLQKASRDEIILCLQGISTFRQYMQTIVRMGTIAETELKDQQEFLDEARMEEDGVTG